MTSEKRLPSSFRDPSGFLFHHRGELFRQINPVYLPHYNHLMESGLYEKLTEMGALIPHEEVDSLHGGDGGKTIRPEILPFVSYPYEWCFRQLRDAAVRTLRIQKRALDHGMSLKDASAYNIQFRHGTPILIDTLSFEVYREGAPWVAYGQFCRHFLAPLALMASIDVRLNALFLAHIDGIPLDLAVRMLPWRSGLRPGLLFHLHLHARSQSRFAGDPEALKRNRRKVSKRSLYAWIDSLETTIRRLVWKPPRTEWGSYYDRTNYSDQAFEGKKRSVERFLDLANPRTVWDLGANTGEFSRLASERGISTVAFDLDPVAVEKNYRSVRQRKERNLLPLVLDLRTPSPSIGWANEERESLIERGPADLVMALALIHHLALSNHVPLDRIAAFFASLGTWLIVEFVPKTDSQVRRLLATREDIFPGYTEEGFEKSFGPWFGIVRKEAVPDSERTLYLMKTHG